MKKLRIHLFTTILWYVISAMWTVTLVFRVTAEEKAWVLIGITCFTLLASLVCAIINHCNYLKAKRSPEDHEDDQT